MNKVQPDLQQLTFPLTRKEDWREFLPRKIIGLQPGFVIIDCLDWDLSCRDFQKIQALCDRASLKVKIIQSNIQIC